MTAKKKRARATGLSEKTDQQLTHTPAEQESQALVEHVEAIRAVGKRVLSDVVEIGRRLTECRRIVGHGKWLAWLEHEFRWSQQTAARFMQVFEFAGKVSKLENLELPVSSLYLLTAPSTHRRRSATRSPNVLRRCLSSNTRLTPNVLRPKRTRYATYSMAWHVSHSWPIFLPSFDLWLSS